MEKKKVEELYSQRQNELDYHNKKKYHHGKQNSLIHKAYVVVIINVGCSWPSLTVRIGSSNELDVLYY